MTRETFLEFCTRPTGFGKTPWPQFSIIVAFSIATVAGLYTVALWAAPLGLLPAVVLVYGTWRNYKGKQA
jgi:hypothetical protein